MPTKTIFEPFRIKSVEPIRWTTRAQREELLRAAHSIYQPNKIVLGNTGAVEPFAKTLTAKEGPTVYLCTGTACQPPTSDPLKVKELLR